MSIEMDIWIDSIRNRYEWKKIRKFSKEQCFEHLLYSSREFHILIIQATELNKDAKIQFLKDFVKYGKSSKEKYPKVKFVHTDDPIDVAGNMKFIEIFGRRFILRFRPKIYSRRPCLFVFDATEEMINEEIMRVMARMSFTYPSGNKYLPDGVAYLILTPDALGLAEDFFYMTEEVICKICRAYIP